MADAAPRLAKNVFEDERIGTESHVEQRGPLHTTGRNAFKKKETSSCGDFVGINILIHVRTFVGDQAVAHW